MKTRKEGFNPRKTAVTTFGLFGALALASAQTIPNPSFEANSFNNFPGYISNNTQIVGWFASDTNRAGLNPASGNPFANNGAVPDGANVAFIQSTNAFTHSTAIASLSTVISNLTVGQIYKVNFRVNARTNTPMPNLKVSIAGTNIVNSTIAPVDAAISSTPYQYFAFDFTASSVTNLLTLSNDATNNDTTVLVDNFTNALRNSGWSYAAWNDDASAGVTTNLYTHAYRFGGTTSAIINGVSFTNIAVTQGVSPSWSGGPGPGQGPFSTANLINVYPINDTNNLTVGTGGSAVLARNFVYGGTPESITLQGLIKGNSYVATIFSVAFDPSASRAATFSVDSDRLTVDQDQFGFQNGIRVSYIYTAVSNSLTLNYVPLQGVNQTFHTYGFCNALLTNNHAAYLIVTNLADSGPGTLRQAIAYAETNDTITFDPSLSGETNVLTGGELLIPYNLTIDASALTNGFQISGNNNSRVFNLAGGTAVTLNSLTIQNANVGGGNGAGIYVNSGASVALKSCTLSGNSADDGGGIYVDTGASLTLTNCTLSGNSVSGVNPSGGGIYVNGGTAAVNNSTFSGNSATFGGGIYMANSGTVTINNSTFSGNSAVNIGGGIVNAVSTLTINNSTFSGNSAGSTGGGLQLDAAISTCLTNTIVAGNTANPALNVNTNIAGPYSSANNLVGVNPLLTPLGNYGGPTQTMPPLPGSPALDAGNNSVTNFLATDQRGSPRLAGAHVDIGAVEYIAGSTVITNLGDSGSGSLRDAATSSTNGTTITFASSLSGQTNVLTSGELLIPNNLTIDASALSNGFKVSGNTNSRVLEVAAGTVATLNSLTIQNGITNNGGGILVNGGASLTLTNCTVSGNSSTNGLGGGGIFVASGALTVNSSTVSSNSSADFGGGIWNSNGVVNLNNSTLSGNVATNQGGAIFNDNGATLLVTNSMLSGNSAGNEGGGIGNFEASVTLNSCTLLGNLARTAGGIENGGGTLTVSASTFSGNQTTNGNGGAIQNDTGSSIVVNNSTFSGNSAPGFGGAGLENIATATAIVNNCTFSANSGGGAAGINNFGALFLTNTIVASNTAPIVRDLDLESGGSFSGANNLTNGNPLLAPLGNYGGPTQTMPPLVGSPAIDAGVDSVTNFLATDQRGLPRKIGPHVDIGAVEYVSVSTIVTTTADSGAGSLRDAASDRTNGATITFAPALSGQTNFLTSGQVTISVPLVIDASALPGGFTISGNNNSRVLELAAGAAVTLNSLTIQNGNINGNGGGILADTGVSLTLTNCTLSGNSGNPGGGLFFSSGTLTIYNSTFSSNSTYASGTLGGAGLFLNGGTATISGSTFSSNSAFSNGGGITGGGGIYVNSGAGNASLTLTNCTLSANSASGSGGGGIVFNGSTLAINGSTFSGNTAGVFGGGILFLSGTLTINGSAFSGNSCEGGGGIYLANGTLTINGSMFSTNSSSFGGGGIYKDNGNGIVTINGSTFSTNSSPYGGGIYSYAGSGMVTINGSTFSGNMAATNGGAIYNYNNATLLITNSMLSGNSAGTEGGGIENFEATATLNSCKILGNFAHDAGGIENSNGTLTVSASTFSGNQTTNGNGGALYNDIGGLLVVNNSTFSGNSTPGYGGAGLENFSSATVNNCTFSANSGGGAAGINNFGPLFLTNTIVASNTAPIVPNLDLESGGSFSGANNLTNGNPLLAPLGNYGGPTQTMPPLAGSPALDAGGDSVTNFLKTDQRGFPRLAGAHVDIGAVEYNASSVITTTGDSGTGSLRDAAAFSANGTTVTFTNTLSGQTITLTSGQMLLNGRLAIDGSSLPGGMQISGNSESRIFEVASNASITLSSLTLENGSALDGGAVLVDGGGSLALVNSIVSSNSAVYGGGLFNTTNGTLTVSNSAVLGNVAINSSGGGVDNNGGTLIVSGSTLAGNAATGSGSGIGNGGAIENFSGSTLRINNSTLYGNSAGNFGGGIDNLGTLALTNTIVASNTATLNANLNLAGPSSTVTSNLINGSPLLFSLGNYGGPTPTMPPMPGSPVIDAGSDSVTNFLRTDQRGYPRLSGAHVDIGAVEVQFVAANPGNPPALINPVWSATGGSNTFQFTFTNVSGADFTALTATNLALPLTNWTVLGSIPEISPGQFQFTDPGTTNSPQRFYRVVSP